MRGLSTEDLEFLECYRQARVKLLAGTATDWERFYLVRYAPLAQQLVQRVRRAEVA